MPIPDYQAVKLPLLQLAAQNGGQPFSRREAVEKLARHFRLTPEELEETLESGQTGRFYSRVGWALTYLRKALLLEPAGRAFNRITERGRGVLAQKPAHIDNAFLSQFPEFRAFYGQRSEGPGGAAPSPDAQPAREGASSTPEETIAAACREIRAALADELLEKLQAASPAFFERTVVRLLVAMGYGGTFADAARAVGRSGDGGIDGIIKQDRLGLDAVHVQAKRWKPGSTVGRPDIQQFAGALLGEKASKGVFITTASFTREAAEYARNLSAKIVLIDGGQLAQLMIDHGLGVAEVTSYSLRRLDSDFFDEE